MKKLFILFSLLAISPNKTIGYVDVKGSINNPGVYEIYEKLTIQDIINRAGGLTKDSYTDNINLSKIVKDEMVIYIHSKKEIEKINELNNCICEPIIKYTECDELENNKKINEETNLEKTNIISSTTSNITSSYSTTTKISSIIKPITEQSTSTSKPSITSQQTTTLPISTTIITSNINKKININSCSFEDLISLKGLGESKAKSIINYRNINGEFNTIEDILNVNGIGNKTFENIKDFIEV